MDMTPIDLYKSYTANTLDHSGNDDFFQFVENFLFPFTELHTAYQQAIPLVALIDSEGNWLDVIGAWIGIRRPNVAFRPLADGEVLFQNIGPTDLPFNQLHSLSTLNPGGVPGAVQNTYFPSVQDPFVELMEDDEYRQLLISYQRLRFNGDTLPNIVEVLDSILSEPYDLTEYMPGVRVTFSVAQNEAFQRIVSAQTIFERISNDGILYVIATT